MHDPNDNRGNDNGELTHIRDILQSALEKYRPAKDMEMTKIWDIWDQAVDPATAANAKPAAFKNGTLRVNVSSSVWIHQLSFQESRMMTELNRHLPSPLIRRISFHIGTIHG